jgi:biotin operon repressor
VEGSIVDLSRREWALLRALLQSPGRVLSLEQLRDSLYGYSLDVESNAVNVHVHHLRRKLGSDMVETVRGMGFRLGRVQEAVADAQPAGPFAGLAVSGAVHLWGGVAAWMFADMRHELRSVLDDRLIASARMVAGIVHQFKPHNTSPEDWGPMLNVVARDGVACEVSMIRSEVHTAPTHDAMDADAVSDEASGKAARPALIPASPLDAPRAKTAKTGRAEDSADTVPSRRPSLPILRCWLALQVRPASRGRCRWASRASPKAASPGVPMCLRSMACALRRPTASMCARTDPWFRLHHHPALCAGAAGQHGVDVVGVTRGLRPLESLRQELSERPPGDDSPVAQGRQVKELAPLVQTINHLLQRVHKAIERERRWSDDAAHELRTPLTAVKTHVQVAQMAVANAGSQMVALRDQPGAGKEGCCAQADFGDRTVADDPAGAGAGGGGRGHLQHTLEQLLLLARLDCQPVGEGAGGSRAMACGSEPACAWEALEKAWGLAATAIPSGSLRLRWLPQQALNDARLQDLRVAVPQPLLVSALRNLMENALRYGRQAVASRTTLRCCSACATFRSWRRSAATSHRRCLSILPVMWSSQ